MDLHEALYTTRAMRRVRPDPIPEDVQMRIMDAAIRAPSGGNAQNWRFLLVDDRKVLNGIYWRLRTGSPWADIPERYGPSTTCYNRFVRWRKMGVWDRIFVAVAAAYEGDMQMVDSSSIRVHQHAALRQQRLHHGQRGHAAHSHVQRRALLAVAHVHVGAVAQQQLRHLGAVRAGVVAAGVVHGQV